MAKALKKPSSAETRARAVPRKRRIQPVTPPKPDPEPEFERSVGLEILAVLLFAFGFFLFLSLISFLTPPTLRTATERGTTTEAVDDRGFLDDSRVGLSEGDGAKRTPETASPTRAQAALGNPASHNIMGKVGDKVSRVLFGALGYCSFVTVLWALLLAKSLWQGWWPGTSRRMAMLIGTVLSSFVLAGASAVIASVFFGEIGGGKLGNFVAQILSSNVNSAGTVLLSLVLIALTLTSATGIRISKAFGLGSSSVKGVLKVAYKGSAASGRMVTNVSREGMTILKTGFKPGTVSSHNDENGEEREFVLGDKKNSSAVEKMNLRQIRPTSGEDAEDEEEADAEEESDLDLEFDEDEYDDEDEDDEDEAADVDDREVYINRGNETQSKDRGKKGKAAPPEAPKKRRNSNFQVPPSHLLVKSETAERKGPSDKELLANSKRLEQTLQNFRVGGKVVEVHPGPVVTLYQYEPAAGIKVQRIITLADDLALALKVSSIRVYAPVPGRGTVGIEVPREDREIVRLRDLVDFPDFLNTQHQLPLALGKDTFGDPFIADLAKMPHLLIAGATGTGKSVCINSLILSLLLRHSPDDLRLIMIDPKMLELSVYEEIPHLKAPVVTFPKRARGALWWAVEEMDRRYALMKELGVRNLASYNSTIGKKGGGKSTSKRGASVIELEEKDVVATSVIPALDRELHGGTKGGSEPIADDEYGGQEPLPRIVIVVDELADLMLTVGREIEELLTRLAQKARAAGIHLILATQRPSVDVITGLIKANFPSRISFKVASRIDARTVLDNSGAERLLGQGDMLFLSPGAESPKRLHSPFVSDQEVHDVVEWIRSQGEPDYDPRIEAMIEKIEAMESSSAAGGPEGEEEYDPLYDQACNLVMEKGFASTSMVQRVFRIGYNRAARILETMEREGVVGPADGAKPRQVLVKNRDLD